MSATAGPAVLDALLALAGSSLGPDVEVVDTYVLQPALASVCILGFSDPHDPNGAPAIASRQEPLEGFGGGRREFLTVRCRLTAPVDEPKLARGFLLSKLNVLDDGLRADRSLGGVVIEAHLGPEFELHMFDGPSGDELAYEFTIVADLYL